MVDGGTFNGFTLEGIGLVRAGKVFYRALTQYLTQTSHFVDAFNVLNQSCSDLVGSSGVTADTCQQVSDALLAVEMHKKPCFTPPEPTLELCAEGEAVNLLFQDNLENINLGQWAVSGGSIKHWTGGQGNPDIHYQVAPRNSAFHLLGDNLSVVADSSVELAQGLPLPANARLQFEHFYDIEATYDGGVIEFSKDDGQTWLDAGHLISKGRGYVTSIDVNYDNPLAGRPLPGKPQIMRVRNWICQRLRGRW